ncbi:MAG: DnaJ domain-containing protein [Coprothermobacterota bacterium]|nr:DnaJ domain-containing protein [Coprothermobacterota bacterium]
MEYKDYYQVLGVPRDADEKSIRRAYRDLARKCHPDTNRQDKSLEEKFRQINEAYQVLSNADKRAKYNQLGANWEQLSQQTAYPGPQQGNWQQFDVGQSDFSDFFRAFFSENAESSGYSAASTRRRSPRKRKGEDVDAVVEISLEEAFNGSLRPISFILGGTARTLEVKIPAGVEEGARIRLRGQGYPSTSGGEPGDLYLMVRIAPHPYFERKGLDLFLDLPVTLGEAMLGAKVEAPSLKGPVMVTIPAETQNGVTIRLRGLGLPPGGDQYLKVKVVLPQEITSQEKKLFQELKALDRTQPRSCLGQS